jgi:RHS repeat-associated protein
VFYNSSDTLLETIDYAYDAFNRMVRRTHDADGPGGNAATDQFFAGYDGIHATLEFDGTSGTDLTHRYLWGLGADQLLADEQVSSTTSDGDIYWTLGDQVGTIRDIGEWDSATSEFEIANHREYDSFGNLISETDSSVDVSYGFTGKWTDQETGYTHHLNRWFDPVIGKWLSEDPIGFDGGDSNISRYVANRVTSMVDSNGLTLIEPGTETAVETMQGPGSTQDQQEKTTERIERGIILRGTETDIDKVKKVWEKIKEKSLVDTDEDEEPDNKKLHKYVQEIAESGRPIVIDVVPSHPKVIGGSWELKTIETDFLDGLNDTIDPGDPDVTKERLILHEFYEQHKKKIKKDFLPNHGDALDAENSLDDGWTRAHPVVKQLGRKLYVREVWTSGGTTKVKDIYLEDGKLEIKPRYKKK